MNAGLENIPPNSENRYSTAISTKKISVCFVKKIRNTRDVLIFFTEVINLFIDQYPSYVPGVLRIPGHKVFIVKF